MKRYEPSQTTGIMWEEEEGDWVEYEEAITVIERRG